MAKLFMSRTVIGIVILLFVVTPSCFQGPYIRIYNNKYRGNLYCRSEDHLPFHVTCQQQVIVTRKHCSIGHFLVNADFLLFIHWHSQHHTPGASPYVTPVITHFVIPILLFHTQTLPHKSIQQTTDNHLTRPLHKSSLFRIVKCLCIYSCYL